MENQNNSYTNPEGKKNSAGGITIPGFKICY